MSAPQVHRNRDGYWRGCALALIPTATGIVISTADHDADPPGWYEARLLVTRDELRRLIHEAAPELLAPEPEQRP